MLLHELVGDRLPVPLARLGVLDVPPVDGDRLHVVVGRFVGGLCRGLVGRLVGGFVRRFLGGVVGRFPGRLGVVAVVVVAARSGGQSERHRERQYPAHPVCVGRDHHVPPRWFGLLVCVGPHPDGTDWSGSDRRIGEHGGVTPPVT